MGGMPPPPGMGMDAPDPPGKIVQDKPGEQQDVVAVDPDKEEEDDDNKEIEKGAIQDYMRGTAQGGGWQGQMGYGATHSMSPGGILMPNNPIQTQSTQPTQDDAEEVSDHVQRTNVQGYQPNQQWDRRGAVDNETQLYDMDDKNIEEYWDAMVESGQIPASQKPTKGSLAWINPLTFDVDGKEVNADWSESTPEPKKEAKPKKKRWLSSLVDNAADRVFGTDEEIQNETWMETMFQGRPERRMLANPEARRKKAEELVANNPVAQRAKRARELVANKKRTGENTQSTVYGGPYGDDQ
jgi:hypothetical protein